MKLQVGDVLRIDNNDQIPVSERYIDVCISRYTSLLLCLGHFYMSYQPLSLLQADIVVLTTSEENGLCYIETAELDG